ncbi:MAG: hypothetical protein L3J74_13305 [Bacteroidales bacterium]|nr:hypothetical protein [Bacteroidales bacterium]
MEHMLLNIFAPYKNKPNSPAIMNEKIKWIDYKGKEILYCDFRGLNEEELINYMKYSDELLISSGKTEILKINDVRGLFAMISILAEIQKSAERQKKYLKKSAYVGTNGVKKLLDALNRLSKSKAKPFDTLEKAMEWIVK